jgi:hypothetical protein
MKDTGVPKVWIFASAALIVTIIVLFLMLGNGKHLSSGNGTSALNATYAANVSGQISAAKIPLQSVSGDEMVANPAAFIGKKVALSAPVGALFPDRGMFTVTCSCGQTQIPVDYAGTLPAKGASVVANGTLKQDANGKFYFDAEVWAYEK